MNFKNKVYSVGRRILYACLPPCCVLCGAQGKNKLDLCSSCFASLPWNNSCCARCGLPLPLSAPLCGLCLHRTPPYHSLIAAWVYGQPIDRMLSHFKFGSNLATGYVLSTLLTQHLRDQQWPLPHSSWRPDVIIPVPLHTARLRQRGFNQAWEVTRFLARHLATPCSSQLLVRARNTYSQRTLNAEARKLNIRGAFQASDHVAGLNIVLVDDVVTTGTTVTECAKALLTAGAKQVDVCALARAPRFFTSD